MKDKDCYFLGKSGKIYRYADLLNDIHRYQPDMAGKPLMTQIEALGLTEELEYGETPFRLPKTLG